MDADTGAAARGVDIRRAAMDLLARREHSRRELATKLSRRFADRIELIEAEIARLADEGLQSEQRFAESFIRARADRGQGPVRIRGELQARGAGNDTIELAFETCDVDWRALAASVYEKRFGSTEPRDARERAKRLRFLEQRGFSYDQVDHLMPW